MPETELEFACFCLKETVSGNARSKKSLLLAGLF